MAIATLSTKSRILVVGTHGRTPLFHPLERDGYEVLSVDDGRQALTRVRERLVDLIILDALPPRDDGLDVCRRLRAHSAVPIIMLSPRSSDLDRVHGLESGADDYITQPVSALEFRSRVRALLRRAQLAGSVETPGRVQAHGLVIDLARRLVLANGAEVELTRVEFELLAALCENAGQPLSRSVLLERVWGDSRFRDLRSVDVHIRHLRQKLEHDPVNPRVLLTVRGVGYRFREF